MTAHLLHRLVAGGSALLMALHPLGTSLAASQTADDWAAYHTKERVDADRRAAQAGDTAAKVKLGWRYVIRNRGTFSGKRNPTDAEHRTGVTQDDAEAVRWFRQAVEAGDGRAMAYLGFMYESGKGVKQDFAEAIRWYRKGSDTVTIAPGETWV